MSTQVAEKACSKCKAVKPLGEFYRDRRNRSGVEGRCKMCRYRATPEAARESKRRQYTTDPERFKAAVRAHRYQVRYGITVQDYDRMLVEQNGACAICDSTNPRSRGRFHVDHNHETGVVRGLLCGDCNRKLAVLEDEEWRLRAEAFLAKEFG